MFNFILPKKDTITVAHFDHSRKIIFVIDKKSLQIMYANHAAAFTYRLDRQSLLNLPITSLLNDPAEALLRFLDSSSSVEKFRSRDKDAFEFHVAVSKSPGIFKSKDCYLLMVEPVAISFDKA